MPGKLKVREPNQRILGENVPFQNPLHNSIFLNHYGLPCTQAMLNLKSRYRHTFAKRFSPLPPKEERKIIRYWR